MGASSGAEKQAGKANKQMFKLYRDVAAPYYTDALGQLAQRAGIGQAQPGVQQGSKPPGMGVQGFPDAPAPAAQPGSMAGALAGWNQEDQTKWLAGLDALDSQFNRVGRQATAGVAGRLGTGQNSIQAGLQSSLARGQRDALSTLARDITTQSIQEPERRLMLLLQALNPGLGMGPAAAGGFTNLAGLDAQRYAANMNALSGLSGFATLIK